MFGGRKYLGSNSLYYQVSNELTAPPQLSATELKAQEQEATLTFQKLIVGAVLLYLCMF
jgi:hypothetical protein